MLKYPYVASSLTVEGVTFTDNGDGSIRINGTASKEARFNLQWDNKVPAGSYSYIVFNLPNNCFANYYTIGNKYGEDVGNRTSDTEINLGSSIVVPAGVTVSNVTVYPMLVSGTYTRQTIPNWEKYTGGIASPNPNYEQPIYSAGDNIQLWGGFTFERSASGITFNQNADGTVTANGTATASVSSLTVGTAVESGICKTLAAGTYIVSGGLSSSLKVQVYDSNINLLATDTGSGSLFTLTEEKTVVVRLTVDTNVTVNNQTFYLKLEKGNKASGFSPYGMGSITEKIGNKNIVNWAKNLRTSLGGLTSVINADGSITTTGKPNYNYVSIIGLNITNLLENGKTYTLSQKTNQGTKLYLQINAKNNTTGAMSYVSLRGATSGTFTANTENISYILNLQTGTTAEWGESELSITNYYQLEQGSTVSDFVPHEEQDYSIFVQQPFRSIGDVRDCFVKENGNWFERHLPYIATYNGETLPQDVYNEVDNVKYCNEKSMSTTGQFSIGASVQYIDENNWNDLPCTETQIQQLENLPSTYKDFTIINSEDETPAYLEVSGIYDLNKLINN